MSDRRNITIPPIPSWIKVLLLVVLVSGVSIGYTEIRIGMEKGNSYIRFFYVESRIKVSYKSAESVFIDLIRTDTILESNQLTGSEKLEFHFSNLETGVIANFSKIEIVFYVEYQLYKKYDSIKGSFFIEDKTGFIRKHDFDESIEGLPLYVAYIDITISANMWKDAVPQVVSTSVIFHN